jgi:MFS family permease
MGRLFAALHNPQFALLWTSELFSQVALNMMNFILLLVVFELTGSNTAVSGLVLAFTLPALLFGLLAGILVDRWDKRTVLVWTNVIRVGLLVVLALMHQDISVIYVIAFLVAVVTQFFIPAETPMVPLVVRKEHLMSANALFSTAWFGAVFLAFALSGPVLLLIGEQTTFFVLAGVFGIAAVCIMLMKRYEHGMTRKVLTIRDELKVALHVIKNVKEVYHAFWVLVFSQVVTLIISVLGPGYANDILKIPVNQFPIYFLTPVVIGMAAGAYTVANVFHRYSRHKSATLGLFLGATALIAMPYAKESAVFIAFLLGFANACMFVPSQVLIQEHTTDNERGKVYGALNTVASLVALVPVLAVGPLADTFGVGSVLAAVGIIIGLIGVMRIHL